MKRLPRDRLTGRAEQGHICLVPAQAAARTFQPEGLIR
jgi:hypothetical protein